MIHVQIASQVTTTGVEGVRWALLDSSPAGGGPGAAAAANALLASPVDERVASPPAAPPAAPDGRPTGLIKLLVVSLALGVALWLAQARLGPLAQRAVPARVAPVPRAPPQAAALLRPASAVPLMTVARR